MEGGRERRKHTPKKKIKDVGGVLRLRKISKSIFVLYFIKCEVQCIF